MSTLKLDTIASRDGTESTDVTNVINGSAKAWVNFDGTGTVAIRDSFNIGSITDNGTGDYTINFTNAMADSSYAAVATCAQNLSSNPANVSIGYPDNSSAQLYSATQFRVTAKFGYPSSMLDSHTVSIAVFR